MNTLIIDDSFKSLGFLCAFVSLKKPIDNILINCSMDAELLLELNTWLNSKNYPLIEKTDFDLFEALKGLRKGVLKTQDQICLKSSSYPLVLKTESSGISIEDWHDALDFDDDVLTAFLNLSDLKPHIKLKIQNSLSPLLNHQFGDPFHEEKINQQNQI